MTTAPTSIVNTATRKRPRWALAAAVVAILFGVVTVIVGGRTLFGGVEERIAAGHFVPFVLCFNFLAGFAYVAAGVGLWLWTRWAASLSAVIALATVLIFIAFGGHILLGGAFEWRTMGAMIIRSTVWLVIATLACRNLECFRAVRPTRQPS